MNHIDPNDVVVAELDVLVGSELAALQSQLVMLQQPLRPNWRPYNTDRSGSTARFKPQARRLEIALPLDTKSDNYGDSEDHKKIKALNLRSSAVDDNGTSFAVGVVRGNQLLLMPLDYTLQLRPNMSYLNVDAGKKKDGEESEDEEAVEDAVTAVEVTVKRRETERQQQARLKSFGYLQQEEEQEAWVNLQLHAPDSVPADAIWHKLLSATDNAAADAKAAAGEAGSSAAAAAAAAATAAAHNMPPLLTRREYLRSFVPSSFTNSAAAAAAALAPVVKIEDGAGPSAAAAAAAGSSAAAAAAGGAAAPAAAAAVAAGDVVTPEMSAAIEPIIQMLMSRHPVCSMANIRMHLTQQQVSLARAAAQLSDVMLDALLQSTGHVLLIRRMYVAKKGVNSALEPLRKVVLGLLLGSKTLLRKADVFDAAKAAGLSPSENQYQKVMRELCRNNGNHWTIKTTADM